MKKQRKSSLRKVRYSDPDGSTMENPTAETLAEIIIRNPAAHWRQGTGISSLDRQGCDESLIFFVTDSGVYVAFLPRGQVEVVAKFAERSDETIEHYVHGEPMVRPRQCFLPRELALEVIEEFIAHGRRLAKLTWAPISEIEYPDPKWDEK